jgi:hypothetical protein
MNEDRKGGAQGKRVTRTEFEVAMWRSHMRRLRDNEEDGREPGEVFTRSEFLEPCEIGDSFEDEMNKLIAAADRAYHDACLRARKRVEACDKLRQEMEEEMRKLHPPEPEDWDARGQGLLFRFDPWKG